MYLLNLNLKDLTLSIPIGHSEIREQQFLPSGTSGSILETAL